jgi:hypothetical protein
VLLSSSFLIFWMSLPAACSWQVFEFLFYFSSFTDAFLYRNNKTTLQAAREDAFVHLAKSRLGAVLADPGMRLPDLASAMDVLCGGAGQGPEREAHLAAALRRLLGRGGGALRALTCGLSDALLALLLCGGAGGSSAATASVPAAEAFGHKVAVAALSRCGAASLLPEVKALAAQLGAVAAAEEAVMWPWLEALAVDLAWSIAGSK